MNGLLLNPIGTIESTDSGITIHVKPKYIPAMTGLEQYHWIQVIWWFDRCDNDSSRNKLIENNPYVNGPDKLGTFATRAPERPNPIAVSNAYVTHIDTESGLIDLAYIDALNQTPVLDIKPYEPSVDRVSSATHPSWCSHWPMCVEESSQFDWETEFNF